MEVDQGQSSGSQGRQPDSLPKVPPQRAAFRAREHQGVIVRPNQPGHVLPDTRHDGSRQDDYTLTCIRLWRARGELAAAQLSHLPNDMNRASV
jgi:hypothetical protein